MLPPFPLEAILEEEGGPYVEAELERRLEASASDQQGCKESRKWVAQHMQAAEARGLTWPLAKPAAAVANDWFQTSSEREQDLIVLGQLDGCAMRDVSQSINRTRDTFEAEAALPTILPNSRFWHYGRERYVLGRELLSAQGYPWQSLQAESLSEAQAADLAGNGFACSCALALDLSLLLLLGTLAVQAPSDSQHSSEVPDLRSGGVLSMLRSLASRSSDADDRDDVD